MCSTLGRTRSLAALGSQKAGGFSTFVLVFFFFFSLSLNEPGEKSPEHAVSCTFMPARWRSRSRSLADLRSARECH